MPDERLFHLALGHSNKVNQLTDFERWVWAIYKLASDDFGVMRFSPTPLKEAADFLEAKSDRLVQRGLEVVRDVGLILTFEHQSRVYCFQRDWQTWQKITHPRATMQPAPPLDIVDLNTQWLLTLHPKGGKLTSWQHPDNRKKTGSSSEVVRENSRKTSEVLPEKSSPVFVDVVVDRVGVGVRGRGDAPRSRRSAGLMAGSLPANHGNCLVHGPVCFRPPVAAKYLPRFGGDQARMVEWATAVCADWTDRTERGENVPEGDDFAFWAARYDEHYKRSHDAPASKLTQALVKASEW